MFVWEIKDRLFGSSFGLYITERQAQDQIKRYIPRRSRKTYKVIPVWKADRFLNGKQVDRYGQIRNRDGSLPS